jgi:hypothetical protein
MRSAEIASLAERCRRAATTTLLPAWNRAELKDARELVRRSLRTVLDCGREWALAGVFERSWEGRAIPVTPVLERNSPAPGSTCAHVCAQSADHSCETRATTHIEFTNPAGGRTRVPLCGPCHRSETTAIEARHVH